MKNSALKQRILKAATFEFITTGIKPVTMDSLSHKLKISKRTLYETFRDKEELLCESFVLNNNMMHRYIQSRTTETTSSLEIVSLFFFYKIDEANYLSPRFYFDLVKYPRVLKFLENMDLELKNERDALLERCIEEGYFRTDIEYSIIGEMLSRQTMYILTNSIPGTKATKALLSMFYVCLRGCCTLKGQEAFESLQKEHYRTMQPTTPEILRKRLEEL